MAQLRQDYDKFVEKETAILVVGPEGQSSFQKFWKENQLPFTGLPDPKHTVLKRYGQKINLFKLGRMPAQALIDKKGVVRYLHYGSSMSDIPENEEILQIVEGFEQE